MVILDKNGSVVESPDYEKGHVDTESMSVAHKYVVDTEEKGHWETIAEYPETGGADVEWRIDTKKSGHWETVDEDGKPVEHYDGVIPEDWPHEQEIEDVWTFGRYIEYTKEELEEIERRKSEAEAAERKSNQIGVAVAMLVRSIDTTTMNDDDMASLSELYGEWSDDANGTDYKVGDTRRHDGKLWRCSSAHKKQEDWAPGVAAALWYEIEIASDGVLVWRRPSGAHDAPGMDAKRHYPNAEGPIYVSKRDGNTSEPGTDEWWELEGGAE